MCLLVDIDLDDADMYENTGPILRLCPSYDN